MPWHFACACFIALVGLGTDGKGPSSRNSGTLASCNCRGCGVILLASIPSIQQCRSFITSLLFSCGLLVLFLTHSQWTHAQGRGSECTAPPDFPLLARPCLQLMMLPPDSDVRFLIANMNPHMIPRRKSRKNFPEKR